MCFQGKEHLAERSQAAIVNAQGLPLEKQQGDHIADKPLSSWSFEEFLWRARTPTYYTQPPQPVSETAATPAAAPVTNPTPAPHIASHRPAASFNDAYEAIRAASLARLHELSAAETKCVKSVKAETFQSNFAVSKLTEPWVPPSPTSDNASEVSSQKSWKDPDALKYQTNSPITPYQHPSPPPEAQFHQETFNFAKVHTHVTKTDEVIASENKRATSATSRVCSRCFRTSTPRWRRDDMNNLLCNACGLYLSSFNRQKGYEEQALLNGSEQSKLTCSNCKSSSTSLWRRNKEGQPVCNACGLYFRKHNHERPVTLATGVVKRRRRWEVQKMFPPTFA
eukprot:Colp12_sorted_trinity150504_noHs@21406